MTPRLKRIIRRALAGISLFALASCSTTAPPPAGTTADAQAAIVQTATAVAAISSTGSSVLTKAASAACAGQALANVTTDMLTQFGETAAAQKSATVSAALGQGCVWGSVL